MIYTLNTETPLGTMCFKANENAVTELSFGKSGEELPSPLLIEAEKQLQEYFSGKRRSFELPTEPKGTEFQKSVWRALCDIPYGETRSYGEVAAMLGNPKAARAVGMANNRNPIAIMIPCHRVIGADGAPVGYGGGLDKKLFLLTLERGTENVY